MKKLKFEIPVPREEDEQSEFIAYCEMNNIDVISTQNGAYLGEGGGKWAYIEKLKRLGLAKGFPDLIILAKNSQHSILFLEMKRTKGGKLSEDQEKWIKKLDTLGYCVGVAYGATAAIKILQKYLAM